MIKSILLENFRGLKQIELLEVQQLTLISGKNNSGKSSILEGILLMIDHISPDSFVKMNYFRNMTISYNQNSLWNCLFYNLDTKLSLRFFMELDNNQSAHLEYQRDDSFILAEKTMPSQEIINSFLPFEKSNYALKFKFIYEKYKEEGHFSINSS